MYVLESGGRLHADSLGSLKELVGGAVREQMTRGSLESAGDVEAEVEAQCAKLCRRIGDRLLPSKWHQNDDNWTLIKQPLD